MSDCLNKLIICFCILHSQGAGTSEHVCDCAKLGASYVGIQYILPY